MQKDLDIIIENIRDGERAQMLEFPDKISDVTIQKVMTDILLEASGLNREATNDNPIVVPITVNKPSKKLEKIDNFMKKLPLYMILRPLLKRGFKKPLYSIDGLNLLQYNNKEFVRAVYIGILGRNAEQSDIDNLTIPIVTGEISKIQLIDQLLRSDEHSIKNIGVNGLGGKRFKERFKRFIIKIPIIGYLLRFIKDIILLPKNIKQINKRLSLLEFSLQETNDVIKRINNIIGNED